MADDLIDEWKRTLAPPAPAAAPPRAAAARAPEPAHGNDLIDEWKRSLPSRPQAGAGASEMAGRALPPDVQTMVDQDWVNQLTRGAHGHGNPTITTLITGQRPDSWSDVATRTAAGFLGGARDVAGTIAQGIAATGDTGAGLLSRAGIVSPETARSVADWRAAVNERIAAVRDAYDAAAPGTAGTLGRIGGQIAATGPLLRAAGAGASYLGRLPGASSVIAPAAQWAASHPYLAAIPRGAATGAAANVLTSSASDAPLWEQAGFGAAGGAALGPIGHGLGNLFTGAVDRETADLAKLALDKYKIPIRVDQISANPMARFGGSVAQRTPGTGLGANVAKQQAAFNTAVANTFGENADKITPTVMAAAKARIGNVFDTTLPNLEAHLKPLAPAIQRIADATEYLPQEDGKIIMRHVNDVIRQFTGVSAQVGAPSRPVLNAKISGDQLQALITKNSPLDRAINGGSANVRYYASQIKDALFDAVSKTATGQAKRSVPYLRNLQNFNEARYQYKNMKTVEDLAEKATTGDVSPALLMGQVRQSFGNMAYGGGGDLADLARIGQRFLKEPPSSGTAERQTLINLGLGAAAGAGGIAAFDAENFNRDAAILGGALLGGRLGGAGLASRMLARAAVKSGHRTTAPVLPAALTSKLPFFAPRHNPLTLPVPDQNR